MSAATDSRPPGGTGGTGRLAPTDPAGPAASAGRGSLTIDERVVRRVAGYAVTLVDGAAAAPRRVLGVALGSVDADDQPHVAARVDGGSASVEASIAVAWPLSVREVADRVRRRVRDEVHAVTGVVVDHVDLDVTSLAAATATSTPRVR